MATKGFVAEKSVTIHASTDSVWRALTDPALVKEYMHGTTMATTWEVGCPITWTGEWKGSTYEDKGTVLALEPNKRLTYTHWSSMGGSEDKPENYHAVTYELAPRDGAIVLTVKQDNNASQDEADTMAANNWGPVLDGIKAAAEK